MDELIPDAPNLLQCLLEIEKFIAAEPGSAEWEKQKKIATNAVAHIKRLEGKEPGWENFVKCPTRLEYLH